MGRGKIKMKCSNCGHEQHTHSPKGYGCYNWTDGKCDCKQFEPSETVKELMTSKNPDWYKKDFILSEKREMIRVAVTKLKQRGCRFNPNYIYFQKDVKEFIRLLKEFAENKRIFSGKHVRFNDLINEIDKIAGEFK
jgi:hypothetical protein